MTQTADKTMARVLKILDQAERAGTAEEAERFTERAAVLMADHSIDQAMIEAARALHGQPAAKPEFHQVILRRPFPHQRKDLLAWTADAMRLHPVTRTLPTDQPGQYRHRLAVELFGAPADIDRCKLLYNSLEAQAEHLLAAPSRRHQGSAWKQSWLNGFAYSVTTRIRDAEANAVVRYDTEHRLEAGQKTAALVLAGWDAVVLAFRAERFPTLGPGKVRSSSGSGFADGRAAGESADVTSRLQLA